MHFVKVATTLVIASLFVIALGSPPAAALEDEGTVLVSVPEVVVQEVTSACDPDAADNGVFGVWYDVSDYQGDFFQITPLSTLDVDPIFYDGDCEEIPGNGGAALGFLGAIEQGFVPSGAEHILVYGYAGSGTFTISI